MKIFCDSYSPRSLIKQPTCDKNPSHHKCIDLIIVNIVPGSFQTICVIEAGLSDFRLMTLTGKSFKKLKPRVINYRFVKHFSNEIFSLLRKLVGKIISTDACQ